MSAHHSSTNQGHFGRTQSWLRRSLTTAVVAASSVNAIAANITVNSLLDDVFPDAAGAIAAPLTAPKCTLRMAIASANLDLPVGGATNGCVAGTGSTYQIAGADTILFATALANGTIMLDATQAMNVGTIVNNVGSILYITGPTTIDGSNANSITLDGGSLAATTTKRILSIFESAPSGETRAGSSIWVNLYLLNFQNARAESAPGGCVRSFENVRIFTSTFTNCISANTPTVSGAQGGALYMRAADGASSTFRPDARLTRVTFKGNKALAGGNTNLPHGGAFYLAGRMGNVVFTDVIVGGPNAGEGNVAEGGYGGG